MSALQASQQAARTQRHAPPASTSGRPCCAPPSGPSAQRFAARGQRSSRRRAAVALRSAVAEGALLRWLDLPADKLPFREDAQQGLVTTKPVGKGSAILSMPASRWITTATVAGSEIGPHVGRLQPWVQLALFLLLERSKPSSQWQAYLDSLPERLDTPLLWGSDELQALLQGTQLLDTVFGYREFFSSKFAELQQQVFPKAPQLFSPEAFSEQRWLWAACVLRSRVHAPLEGDSLALVPLADQVRHQRGPGAAWKLAGGGFGRGERALVMEAERAFDAGEPITMDYGPQTLDAEILLNYGAMDEYITKAGFSLNLELPEDDRFADDKADILEINGFATSQEFVLKADAEPSEDLLGFLRLINLSGADAFLLESLFRNEAWGHLQKPVSLENETAVFTSMLDGCRETLARYGGSIADFRSQLRAAEAGSRAEQALRVRIGEMEALDGTLQFFEERVSQLSRLEFYQERRLKRLGLLDDDGQSTFDDFFKDGVA